MFCLCGCASTSRSAHEVRDHSAANGRERLGACHKIKIRGSHEGYVQVPCKCIESLVATVLKNGCKSDFRSMVPAPEPLKCVSKAKLGATKYCSTEQLEKVQCWRAILKELKRRMPLTLGYRMFDTLALSQVAYEKQRMPLTLGYRVF